VISFLLFLLQWAATTVLLFAGFMLVAYRFNWRVCRSGCTAREWWDNRPSRRDPTRWERFEAGLK
jgi:hypothetical protein